MFQLLKPCEDGGTGCGTRHTAIRTTVSDSYGGRRDEDRLPQLLAKRPIHLTPVADIVHCNLFGLAIDFVDDPIITHTQTI